MIANCRLPIGESQRIKFDCESQNPQSAIRNPHPQSKIALLMTIHLLYP